MTKKRISLIVTAVIIIGLTAIVLVPRLTADTNITPLRAAGEQEPQGQRLVISFEFERLNILGSNQFAFWIEDMNGNYITTLYATNFTARTGHRTRPSSLPQWVTKANPAAMPPSRIDAISGATPRSGEHFAVWNFTDANGVRITGTQFRYFAEASVNFNRGENSSDSIIYSGVINAGSDAWNETPAPTFSNPQGQHNHMIRNVHVTYFPR